jgi:hypothetical protein
MAGYCGCTLQDFRVETCNDIGLLVSPDPTGLCNVFLNSPMLATSNTLVSWKDLALTSCALLDTTRTLCFKVDASGGTQIIAAPTAVVGFEFIASSRRRRRHLLSAAADYDDDGFETGTNFSTTYSDEVIVRSMLWNASWDQSGELCAALIHAYRQNPANNNQPVLLSVTDIHGIKQCLHWRMAGNHTLQKYVVLRKNNNNSGSGECNNDQFLLSYMSLAKALGDSVCVTAMLDNFPSSLFYVLSFADWAAPAVKGFEAAEQYAGHLQDYVQQFLFRSIDNSTSFNNNSKSFNNSRNPTRKKMKRVNMMLGHILPFMHAGTAFVSNNLQMTQNLSSHIHAIVDESILPPNLMGQTSTAGRRLLQTVLQTANTDNSSNQESTWKDDLGNIPTNSVYTSEIQMVQAYSALIAAGAYKSALLPADLAARWKTGPFLWPASIAEDQSLPENDMWYCPSGTAAANVIVNAFASLQEQLTNTDQATHTNNNTNNNQRLPLVSKSFPKIHAATNIPPLPNNRGIQIPLGPLLGTITVHPQEDQWANFVLSRIIGFFTGNVTVADGGYTASKLIKEYFVCSFDEVVLKCQRKSTTLVAGAFSIVLLLVLYCIVIGYSAPVFLSAISITGMVLWHVYGYSPACIPMVPPCIVEDVLHIVKWFVPLQMKWPKALERSDMCAFNASVPMEQCFKSCRDPPFMYGAYNGWEATLAWILCDWDPYWCSTTAIQWSRDLGLPSTFLRMLEQKSNTLFFQGYDGQDAFIDAQRFCCTTHLVFLVPYIFILLFVFYGIFALAIVPIVLIQSFFDLILQTLAFTHMQTAVGQSSSSSRQRLASKTVANLVQTDGHPDGISTDNEQ